MSRSTREDHERPRERVTEEDATAARRTLMLRVGSRVGAPRPWDKFVKDTSPFATILAVAYFEVDGTERSRRQAALELLGYSPSYAATGGYYIWERPDVQEAIRVVQKAVREANALDAADLAYRYRCMIEVSPADVLTKLAIMDPLAREGKLANLDALGVLTPEERYAIKSVSRKTVSFEGAVTESWFELEFEPRLTAMRQLAELAGLNAPKKVDAESVEDLVALIRGASEIQERRAQRPQIEDVEWEEVEDAPAQG